ncbi:MAG: TatD family hydrolase [Methylococcaceae bacterium]
MLIDSHCHLDRIDLKPYDNSFASFMQTAQKEQLEHLLCIAIDMERYPALCALVKDYQNISLSVGVHPNVDDGHEPSVDELIALAQNPKVIAIGETGLDYFRSEGDLSWQHLRFRTHIQAAKALNKPLIIHTRNAKEDTLKILIQENAKNVGGIIHCFSEDWQFAQQVLDLGFYISFSGIVTFNSAKAIQEVAQKIPADKFLIETDSPYLAPMPHRGKPNYPHYVRYIAERIAVLREDSFANIAKVSTANFYSLFPSVAK